MLPRAMEAATERNLRRELKRKKNSAVEQTEDSAGGRDLAGGQNKEAKESVKKKTSKEKGNEEGPEWQIGFQQGWDERIGGGALNLGRGEAPKKS